MNKQKGTNYNSFEHKIIIQEAMRVNGKHRTKTKQNRVSASRNSDRSENQ
jgi:hypothetical protein